jgi:hypothetical protein
MSPVIVAIRTEQGRQHVTLREAYRGATGYILPAGAPLVVGDEVPETWLYKREDDMPLGPTPRARHGGFTGLTSGSATPEERISWARDRYVRDAISIGEFERVVGDALGVR